MFLGIDNLKHFVLNLCRYTIPYTLLFITMCFYTYYYQLKRLIATNWVKIMAAAALCIFCFGRNIRLQLIIDEPAAATHFSQPMTNSLLSIIDNGKNFTESGNHATKLLLQTKTNTKNAYIQRFSKVAQGEQQKFGIPASVLLASAMIQSCAGQTTLAASHNNHFALPCNKALGDQSVTIGGQCYRKYPSAWSSFRGFDVYVMDEIGNDIKQLIGKDAQTWARYLSDKHLVSVPANDLLQVIRYHSLDVLDR
jgi:Mannosyl-glycoprotein endo-beta-N-acetylglucosaminidase